MVGQAVWTLLLSWLVNVLTLCFIRLAKSLVIELEKSECKRLISLN